ncbi:hypothetical protein FALCPG4_003947 [Fusarium falciforme]
MAQAQCFTLMAEELAIVCLTVAKERNQLLEDYPLAYPDLAARRQHEQYAENARAMSVR